MKEFDYVIIGGGCAGLSLAYELEIHHKLKNKTLAIIEKLYNTYRNINRNVCSLQQIHALAMASFVSFFFTIFCFSTGK